MNSTASTKPEPDFDFALATDLANQGWKRIEVKFVDEGQEGHPTMCSFTIKF